MPPHAATAPPLDAIANALQQLIALRHKLGYEPVPALTDELARLRREWRVAIVGEFKVGKSTLINKLFLRQELLPRDLLECTAVPTLIVDGQPPQLVIERRQADGSTTRTEIPQPTPADIERAITAKTAEGRSALAKDTVQVQLTWPCAGLQGFAIYDTPGVNSGNEAVITTTYRIVPESDCVVFLKQGQQFSQAERSFLTTRILDQGLQRVLLLVTFRDIGAGIDEDTVQQVCAAVQAELAAMQRSGIAVQPVTLFSVEPIPGTIHGDELRERIVSFVMQNAGRGRCERAAHVVRREATATALSVQAELAGLDTSAEQRQRLIARIDQQSQLIQLERQRLAKEVELDLAAAKRACLTALRSGLQQVGERFAAGFTEEMKVSEMQARLQAAGNLLRPDIERTVHEVIKQLQAECSSIAERHRVSIEKAEQGWRDIAVGELHIDAGMLSRMPSWMTLALDVILTDFVSPLPIWLDVIVRFVLLEKIPALKALMPSQILQNTVRQSLMSGIPKAMEEVAAKIEPQISKSLDGLLRQLQRAIVEAGHAEIATVRKALDQAPAADPERRRLLLAARDELTPLTALSLQDA